MAKKKTEKTTEQTTEPKKAEPKKAEQTTEPKKAEQTTEQSVIEQATALATGRLNFSQVRDFLGNFLSDNEIEEISKKHEIYSENADKIASFDDKINKIQADIALLPEGSASIEILYDQIQALDASKRDLTEKKIELPVDFQAQIDDFFLSGLNGLKTNRQGTVNCLVLTEAEAAVSGTQAVNYLVRNELLNQSEKIEYDEFKSKIKALTGRYLKSDNHFDHVMKQAIKAGLLVGFKYIQSHGKQNAFWQIAY